MSLESLFINLIHFWWIKVLISLINPTFSNDCIIINHWDVYSICNTEADKVHLHTSSATVEICQLLEILPYMCRQHTDYNGSDLSANCRLFTVTKQQHNLQYRIRLMCGPRCAAWLIQSGFLMLLFCGFETLIVQTFFGKEFKDWTSWH